MLCKSTYEIFRIGMFVKTERKLKITGGWERGELEVLLNSYRVSVCSDENVLEIDSDDGCTILWIRLMPLTYTLENGSNGKFYVTYISCQILKTYYFFLLAHSEKYLV